MTAAAATVFPSHNGGTATGPACEEQDLPVRSWKLIYAAHTDNSLDWRDMISFEAYLRRPSSLPSCQNSRSSRYDSQKAKLSIMPGPLFPDHIYSS